MRNKRISIRRSSITVTSGTSNEKEYQQSHQTNEKIVENSDETSRVSRVLKRRNSSFDPKLIFEEFDEVDEVNIQPEKSDTQSRTTSKNESLLVDLTESNDTPMPEQAQISSNLQNILKELEGIDFQPSSNIHPGRWSVKRN